MFPMPFSAQQPYQRRPYSRFSRYRRRVYGTRRFKRAFYKCRAKGGSRYGCMRRAKRSTAKKYTLKTELVSGQPVYVKVPRKGYAVVIKKADPKRAYVVRAKNGEVPEKYRNDDYIIRLPLATATSPRTPTVSGGRSYTTMSGTPGTPFSTTSSQSQYTM